MTGNLIGNTNGCHLWTVGPLSPIPCFPLRWSGDLAVLKYNSMKEGICGVNGASAHTNKARGHPAPSLHSHHKLLKDSEAERQECLFIFRSSIFGSQRRGQMGLCSENHSGWATDSECFWTSGFTERGFSNRHMLRCIYDASEISAERQMFQERLSATGSGLLSDKRESARDPGAVHPSASLEKHIPTVYCEICIDWSGDWDTISPKWPPLRTLLKH